MMVSASNRPDEPRRPLPTGWLPVAPEAGSGRRQARLQTRRLSGGHAGLASALATAALAALTSAVTGGGVSADPPSTALSSTAVAKVHGAAGIAAADVGVGEGPSVLRVRGVVAPRQQATISAAQIGTITAIGPETGERFEKGRPLVTFDCGVYRAELKRAEALAEGAAQTAEVRRALAASGSISKLQAELAEAELKKAGADVFVAAERVSYCVIPAPYDGRVVRRVANAHETVGPRDPLIEIIDDRRLEVRAFVPSRAVRVLTPGQVFTFQLEETGARIAARIVALGATIDSVSQLIEVRGEIIGPAVGEAAVGEAALGEAAEGRKADAGKADAGKAEDRKAGVETKRGAEAHSRQRPSGDATTRVPRPENENDVAPSLAALAGMSGWAAFGVEEARTP